MTELEFDLILPACLPTMKCMLHGHVSYHLVDLSQLSVAMSSYLTNTPCLSKNTACQALIFFEFVMSPGA